MRRQKEADDKSTGTAGRRTTERKNEILMEFEESGAQKSESPGARLDTDPVIPDVMSVKPFLVAEETAGSALSLWKPQETLYGLARVPYNSR